MGLDKDILHLQNDPVFKNILTHVEISPLSPRSTVFESLMSSIVSQQLSVKVAKVIFDRFQALFNEKIITPTSVRAKTIAELRSVGLSNQKANYVKNIAEFFIENRDLEKRIVDMEDQTIIDLLTQIKGVGVWTVQMILIFHLGRKDVFPIGDLGIRNAIIYHYQLKEKDKKKLYSKMEKIARSWSPYRSIASRYLWASMDNMPNNK